MSGIAAGPVAAAGAVDLLRGTKEMLLREGYCKGAYVEGEDDWPTVIAFPGSNPCGTAHCLLGSLRVVAGYHPLWDAFYAESEDADSRYRVALRMMDSLVPADVIREAAVQGFKSPAESYAEAFGTTVGDLVDLIDRAISELAPAAAPREAVTV